MSFIEMGKLLGFGIMGGFVIYCAYQFISGFIKGYFKS